MGGNILKRQNRRHYERWLYHGSAKPLPLLWFAAMMAVLVLLDGAHMGVIWLVPPFAATLSILVLLPESPIAQPFTVIGGSTMGASVGTLVSLFARGPMVAALTAVILLAVLPAIRLYHPPGVALSMYPLLLRPGLLFPLEVVLPFTCVAVCSAALLSRFASKRWPVYPVALRDSTKKTENQES